MTADFNPYQPPETIEALVDHHAVPRSFDYFALIAWPIVQACNMFLAALFGWGITQDHGRIGIFFAAMWFLVAGWFLCCVRPVSARKLIFGAILLALTQVFPIIQMIAGTVAFMTALSLGLAAENPETVTTEFGGFLMTFIVGGILICCAWVMGLIVGLMVPQSWLRPN